MAIFLQKDLAQVLRYKPSLPVDSANTPTVAIYSEAGSLLVASQNATKGFSATISAVSSGSTTVTVSSATSISVGDHAWIGPATTGQYEIVCISAISSTTITLRDSLIYSYAASTRFHDAKISVSLTADNLSDVQRNCQARWTYQSNSVSHSEIQIFNVSTYAPVCTVTEQDILRRFSIARNTIGASLSLPDLIKDIWENEVISDLSATWEKNSIISGECLHTATINRVIAHLYLINGKTELFDKFIELYKSDLERAIRYPVDTDQDGDTTDELVKHPFIVRIVRG